MDVLRRRWRDALHEVGALGAAVCAFSFSEPGKPPGQDKLSPWGRRSVARRHRSVDGRGCVSLPG